MKKKISLPRFEEGLGSYYFPEDLKTLMSKEELKVFDSWMSGQTVSCVGGNTAVYACDVDRFLRNKENIVASYKKKK